jgi:hypothetical protein
MASKKAPFQRFSQTWPNMLMTITTTTALSSRTMGLPCREDQKP